MTKLVRPKPLQNVLEKIRLCIEEGKYAHTEHAFTRQNERSINLAIVLYVLKHGRHEKNKSFFDEQFQNWKYAIRGKSLDGLDIRIIVAFDDKGMLIITVMHVGKL